MAIKLATHANAKVTGELPKAGVYNLTYDNYMDGTGIEMEEKAVSFDMTEDFAVIISATVHMEKDTLAIKSIELTLDAAAVISVDAKNFPMIEDDWSGFSSSYVLLDVSYTNYEIEAKAVLEAKMTPRFTPALNLYEFPLDVGNEWQVDSVMNVTGEVDGFD